MQQCRDTCQLQVHSKGHGGSGEWQLKKRYGYFERVHALAVRCAKSLNDPAPALPRRKMLNHRDPKYLATLRDELQQYMERVVDLVWRMMRKHAAVVLALEAFTMIL